MYVLFLPADLNLLLSDLWNAYNEHFCIPASTSLSLYTSGILRSSSMSSWVEPRWRTVMGSRAFHVPASKEWYRISIFLQFSSSCSKSPNFLTASRNPSAGHQLNHEGRSSQRGLSKNSPKEVRIRFPRTQIKRECKTAVNAGVV